ncbi:MAG TPA: histidinol dehydrogenase, partial [Caldimonas sp.]
MAVALDMQSADFEQRFAVLLAAKRESSAEVDAVVAAIIADVRGRGDEALADYSLRFDRVDLARLGLRISAAEVEAATAACKKTALDALELAHDRVTDFHRRQKPADLRFTDPLGVELGWRWRPIDAVGLYVPGGAASYPSSVVMNAVPAKVAGCRRLAMVVPTPDGHINPLVLAAARIAGVDEIYRVGGAQAIAALAYGTQTIAPVDKIVGPGNAYVAAAKRRVFGVVGIDMIAGPSEVVILADRGADPRFVAADLMAQAEHDEAAQSILITDDASLARAVRSEVDRQLADLPRAEIARASWRENGAVILSPSL